MFSFTSPGMSIDEITGRGRGPPTLRIQGQTCHRIGSMLPEPGQGPRYAQLYIYDTDNEVQNRIQGFRFSINIHCYFVVQIKCNESTHLILTCSLFIYQEQ
jgi:hypothetical protein